MTEVFADVMTLNGSSIEEKKENRPRYAGAAPCQQRCTLVSCFVIIDNERCIAKTRSSFIYDLRVLKQTAKGYTVGWNSFKKLVMTQTCC